MAINIKFDNIGNPELPTLILATRNGKKLGQIDANKIELNDKFVDAPEISFVVYKYNDYTITNLWDKIIDFKLVYCKEWDLWFEIKVELDEETETVKTVFGKQLGQSELSQIMLFNVEINTENDIARDDYKITVLYSRDSEASLLHRILDKAPHYSIDHVDATIMDIQRTFTFDDISIYDAFLEIAEEIGCLFVYNSSSDENGKPLRSISVYDLEQNCNGCGYRGEYTDVCPKCGSTDIKYGYGNDTLIFVTSDELATNGIQLRTNSESVKNCFKLEAGDDLMTATIRNCNPNGTNYIWRISDFTKEDMSKGLVEKLESYDELYKYYYNEHLSNLDSNLLSKYNSIIDKYSVYRDDLKKISSPIKGYPSLMNAYYNVIDLSLYLESGMMPEVKPETINASTQLALLTSSSLSPTAVANAKNVSKQTSDSAILAMAKTLLKSGYKVDIKQSEIFDRNDNSKTWKGSFIVTNYHDENDTATGDTITTIINDDDKTYISQRLQKTLSRENTDDVSITGLFAKDYNSFCSELKKYALKRLISFQDACQSCLDILIEQGVASNNTWGNNESSSNLYNELYVPYYNKLKAIKSEIGIRENEIAIVFGKYDKYGNLVTNGLGSHIEKIKNQIQDILDFEKYLGEELWFEFCAYRREDKYLNDNYISDGLNNAELFDKAIEFIEVAENEIYKSSELQYSISTTLNNLLAIDKFQMLIKYFEVGNWIRIQVDDCIYKLRLLDYDIEYDNFDIIPVIFSNVTKIKTGLTDTIDILSKASSMATSYESVKRQSKQGNEAQGTIEKWLSSGLNSALVQIQNNTDEEIVIDKNGLLCRTYNDIVEDYNPEQLKLTHNIMAYTNDNWESVKQAIGKHEYTLYDTASDGWEKSSGYGMSADFVNAGQVMGSVIVGGEIYSSNYHKGIIGNIENLPQGTYINLKTGDFELASGKFIYNAEENNLTLDGVTIKWNTTNSPTTSDIDGLDSELDALNQKVDLTQSSNDALKDYIDVQDNDVKNYVDTQNNDIRSYIDTQDSNIETLLTSAYKTYTNSKISNLDTAVADHLGIGGGTIIDSSKVISPYIGGGYLNITNTNNNSRVVIDPNNLTNNGYIFQVHNGSKVAVGIDTSGNAYFEGQIKATSGEFTGKVTATSGKIATWEINGNALRTEGATLNGTSGSYIGTDGIRIGNIFKVNHSGTATFKGTIQDGSSVGNNQIKNGFLQIYNKNMAEDLIAKSLQGVRTIVNEEETNVIKLLDPDGLEGGQIMINPASSFDGFALSLIGGAVRLDAEQGDIYFEKKIPSSGSRLMMQFSTELAAITSSSFYPNSTSGALGNTSHVWNNLYVKNSPVVTSDRNKKNSIDNLPDKYITMIDYLSTKRYKLNDGESDRYHIGFIAQDVKDAMDFAQIDSSEFGGWIKDIDADGNDIYMLRYEEFIGLLHAKNKQCDRKLKEAILEIKELKNKIVKLEERL